MMEKSVVVVALVAISLMGFSYGTPVTDEILEVLMNEIKMLKQKTQRLELPIGTIIPWLPSPGEPGEPDAIPDGWVKCDGSFIEEGPWVNLKLPDLNGKGLFLRGSNETMAGTTEEDAIQVHQHEDGGHTHVDSGHAHLDYGHTHSDAGHTHPNSFASSYSHWTDYNWGSSDISQQKGIYELYYTSVGSGSANIQSSQANIASASASIQSSTASIGGPTGEETRTAEETRPANMKVVYIMKIKHSDDDY